MDWERLSSPDSRARVSSRAWSCDRNREGEKLVEDSKNLVRRRVSSCIGTPNSFRSLTTLSDPPKGYGSSLWTRLPTQLVDFSEPGITLARLLTARSRA